MDGQELRVLLADDDHDDYLITRDLLLGIGSHRFQVDWVATYRAALSAIEQDKHDLYLFDYHLGEGDGLELLSKAMAQGCKAPIILLTGVDDWETDQRAIKGGAADYLVKGQFDSKHLERAIRHAMERKRTREELDGYSNEIEVRRTHERLKDAERLALTDALTGLGNRRHAENAIREAMAATQPWCLLVFDVNGFKAINDCYGHAQGDQLLKALAKRMHVAVRDADTVCRWGGDEFVIVLNSSALNDAEVRARQIQASAFGEFTLQRGTETIRVRVSASVGAAQYKSGESAAEFFERADLLLLADKRKHHHTNRDESAPNLDSPFYPMRR